MNLLSRVLALLALAAAFLYLTAVCALSVLAVAWVIEQAT